MLKSLDFIILIVYTAKSLPIETGGVGSLQNLAGKTGSLI
jgi:hypothetical protein